MSEADTQSDRSTVNIRIADTFLDDIDTTWEDEGFNSRSEFIRSVLRDAVKHPAFNRADLKALAASEVDIQEGRVHTSDEIKTEYDFDASATDENEGEGEDAPPR
jgi:metal-responsive CopG/Arc/MetJ family transcriptional regulator